MTSSINVAVIGCGRMGKRRAQAVAASKNAKLVRVLDADVTRAAALGKELGCESGADLARATDGPGVEAVIISTPNSSHAPLAIKAMNHGRHVFCEKPLTTNVQDAHRMLDKSTEKGVVLSVGSNVRFFENVEKARDLLRAKAIGRLLFARGWIGHDGWVLSGDSWSNDPGTIGGGTLIDNGCHIIDITRWLVGEVQSVQGLGSRRLHPIADSMEDNFMGIMTCHGGVPVAIQSSWTDWNGYAYYELCGSEGRMIIDSRGDSALVEVAGRKGPPEHHDFSKAAKVSFKRETEEFLTAVASGSEHVASGFDGVRVVEIISALYRAAKESRVVQVPPTTAALSVSNGTALP